MPQQQTKSFTVNLFPFSDVSLEKIDAWLSTVFDLNVSSYFENELDVPGKNDQLIYELAWRGQQLVNVFLQFANIPAFYSKKEIQVHKVKGGKINIILSAAALEITNADAYKIAIRSAFETLHWITTKEQTSENTQQLYKNVDSKGRTPLKRFFTGGKSTLPVLNAAYEKNIPFIHLGSGVYQLGWGQYARQLSRSTTETDSAIGARTAQDKAKSAVLLRMAGLPAPQHIIANSEKSALVAARQLGWPLVVKPTNCDRGEGVTIGINNNEHLSSSFELASRFSKRRPIIVEREVMGVCHRLFINDEKLLYAIKRRPLSVFGDGERTVAQLITDYDKRETDKAPWLRSHRYLNDAVAVKTMKARGILLTSIPVRDELVPLRPFQSDEWGGTPKDVSTHVHPDNINIAVKAAKIFGLYNAGIDIITPDISQPWHENGAIINEVNFSPLFGGTEISKRYVPTFLENFIDGDGRIQIDVVMGGKEAIEEARKKQKQRLASGVNCVLTSHDLTIDSSENIQAMPFNNLKKRCLALLMDRQVAALVVVVQTNECLNDSLAFDQINSLTKTDSRLCSWKNNDELISSRIYDAISSLFEKIIIK